MDSRYVRDRCELPKDLKNVFERTPDITNYLMVPLRVRYIGIPLYNLIDRRLFRCKEPGVSKLLFQVKRLIRSAGNFINKHRYVFRNPCFVLSRVKCTICVHVAFVKDFH